MKEVKSSADEKNIKTGKDPLSGGLFKLEQILIYAGVLVVVFLLGFFVAWISGLAAKTERDTVRQELRLSQLQNRLAGSMVNARMGEYEQARSNASDFFTDLRAEVDKEENAALSNQQRQAALPILAQRDEIITLLARNDPASITKLTDLYISYMQMMSLVPKQ